MSIRALLPLAFAGVLGAATDATQANSYDDAWQNDWIDHCRTVFTSSGKTAGLVLQVGDSITHANPYSQWPRYGAGKTSSDSVIIAWCHGDATFPGTQDDPTSASGFYLAAADTSGIRGMTCSGGMDTAEFLSGDGNGGTAMPTLTDGTAARAAVADGGAYSGNLQSTTVAAAFANAQVAVLMLGTNDLAASRTAAQLSANLAGIIDAFESRHVVVVLSTIPPYPDAAKDALAVQYCAAIATLAHDRHLPLIDFRAEILARRPGTTWNGTLLTTDDPHPTAGVGGYSASSDPYADGGDPTTHRTGAACLNSGYLLRSWLTIQKLKEVKAALVDGVGGSGTGGGSATGGGSGGSATGGGTTGALYGSGGGSGGSCGIGSGLGMLVAAAILACGIQRR